MYCLMQSFYLFVLTLATQELYLEFKDSLKQQSALHQVLDLVASYESACAKQLSKIQQISKCLVRNQPK